MTECKHENKYKAGLIGQGLICLLCYAENIDKEATFAENKRVLDEIEKIVNKFDYFYDEVGKPLIKIPLITFKAELVSLRLKGDDKK